MLARAAPLAVRISTRGYVPEAFAEGAIRGGKIVTSKIFPSTLPKK